MSLALLLYYARYICVRVMLALASFSSTAAVIFTPMYMHMYIYIYVPMATFCRQN